MFQPSATECLGGNKRLKASPESSPLTRELFQPLVAEFSGGTKPVLQQITERGIGLVNHREGSMVALKNTIDDTSVEIVVWRVDMDDHLLS